MKLTITTSMLISFRPEKLKLSFLFLMTFYCAFILEGNTGKSVCNRGRMKGNGVPSKYREPPLQVLSRFGFGKWSWPLLNYLHHFPRSSNEFGLIHPILLL